MKLDEYLRTSAETADEFARRIGRDPSTVSRIRNGKTRPDWDTMAAIKAATGGAVTPNDFDQEAA